MANYTNQIDKFINIVILIAVFVALIPTITTAFTNLSGTGIPFADFFASGGVALLLLGVYVFKNVITGISKK